MLSGGATFFVVAVGLALIFNLMKIINFAHGAMVMVGAYGAVLVTQYGGSPWLNLPAGFFVGFLVAFVVEVAVMRHLYARPWDTILATIGLALILVAGITLAFGRETFFVGGPLQHPVDLGFAQYSAYRLFTVGVATALAITLVIVVRFTRLGVIARAVMSDQPLAASIGINTQRVRQWTFALGGGLAGLAGGLVAPVGAVEPNMGSKYLVAAFLVVMVAGTSPGALLLASLIFGASESLVAFMVTPLLGTVTIIVFAALLLRFRPAGFQGLAASLVWPKFALRR